MKTALPAFLVVLVGGFLAWYFWSDSDQAFEDVLVERAPAIRDDGKGNPVLEIRRDEKAPVEKRLRFLFLDGANGRPIPGARIYRVRDGEVLATSDSDGFADVVGGRLNALVFGADGYLAEHYFDRMQEARDLALGSKSRGHIRIVLEPDDLTVPFALRFVKADGSEAGEVKFKITCVDEPKPSGKSVPSARLRSGARIDKALRQAWVRHVVLSTIRKPDFNPELYHFGVHSERSEYSCVGSATIRFVAVGLYRIQAWSADEFRRQSFEVPVGQTEPIVIQLRKGQFSSGQVLDRETGEPVVGAMISLRRDGAIVTSGDSDVNGRFKLGPVASIVMRLEIEHPAYEGLVVQAERPGSDRVYQLSPWANHRVHGLVRRRPGLTPVAKAEVRLVSGNGVVAKVRTDAGGRFDLKSYLLEPTVEIRAAGFLEYAEMLNANGEERSFDLIPGSAAERVRAGLSALIHGTVRDAKGAVAANQPVHIRPQTPWKPTGMYGRRIFRGGRVPFSQMKITNAQGEYEIEWPRAEPVRLIAVSGKVEDNHGHFMTVVLGRRYQVQLTQGR